MDRNTFIRNAVADNISLASDLSVEAWGNTSFRNILSKLETLNLLFERSLK